MNVSSQEKLNRGAKSRTEYSAKNTTVAMLARVVAILLGFCTRVVFTHTLSEAYVGINGLFTDILNVLALSELGIGTAITYALYKPIAEQNIERQKSLMQLYKQFYRIVAVIVLAAGLLVIPFMDMLIKNQADVENVTFLYLLYLANSVISYLLIYKRTLIDAYQLSYIGVVYQTVFLIVQNVVQMLVLVTTKNFTLFLSILILCTLLNNLCISRKADQLYPFLKEKQVQPLPKEEKQGIYQNIRAMLMHKIGTVVVNNTDNLLLSSLVGIVSVGMYSNYYLVIGSVRQVLNQAFQGITASVGNLGVEESRERVKRIFEAAFFIGQWMFGFAAICLFELLAPFVDISFGSQYVFGAEITFVLCLNFYFTGMRQATLVFRDSLGLFWYDRYKSLVEAVINLVVSIILGYRFGTIGIFIGTLCSTVTTSLWVEPYMLYKYRLQAKVQGYFLKYGGYFLVTGMAWWITDLLCGYVTGDVFVQFLVRLLICLLVPNLLFLLVYGRSKEFAFVVRKTKGILKRWLQKGRERTNWRTNEHGDGQKVTSIFTKEERVLFRLIRRSLLPEEYTEKKCVSKMERTDLSENAMNSNKKLDVLAEEEWERLVQIAKKHGVLPLLYSELAEHQSLPKNLQQKVECVARQTALQQYRLLFLSKYLNGFFQKANIPAVILKGVTVGAYYPVPELRKSGDVDVLLLNPNDIEAAKRHLEKAGYLVKEEQLALHHICFSTPEGIDIELHTMLAEPFDNEKTNVCLQEILKEAGLASEIKNVMGVELPVLPGAYYAFELLLHMLQHFLRSGFGLKLLCDWVLFWQVKLSKEEQEKYLELVERTGVRGFSDVVTLVCVEFLGLAKELVQWMDIPEDYPVEEFMREALDAEEFGKSSSDRMVVMRGTSLVDYIREFHHQMRLNFPKAGKCFLIWPGLWGMTLWRFVRNNRRLRGISTKSVLCEAARRSRMMRKIKLFR